MINFTVLNIKEILTKTLLCIIVFTGIMWLINFTDYIKMVDIIPIYTFKVAKGKQYIDILNNNIYFIENKIERTNNDSSTLKQENNEQEHIPATITVNDIDNNKYAIDNENHIVCKNKTKFDIDFNKAINNRLNIFNNRKTATILIIHTHGSESYTGAPHTDYFRNENMQYNMIGVGENFAKILSNSGYNVIHDTRLYDFPTYSGSYTRALESIEQYKLEDDIQIVLDIHRDAIASDENYAPTVNINGETAAQIMIIVGTNGGGLEHEEWEENLSFAAKLQNVGEQIYPGLFRNMVITNSRYNQHTTKGSLILEIGATGNTLEQSNTALKYFAKVIDIVLKSI